MAITLIGFMGSGKTTIGRELATSLQLPFIDLDDYIVQQAGRKIADIFAESGEDYFRMLESAALEELIRRRVVLSTGGGIVERESNMQQLRRNRINIWLDADVEVLYHRISTDAERPNANNRPFSAIKDLYNKRCSRYNEIAFINVNTLYSVNDCVEYIINRLIAEEQ